MLAPLNKPSFIGTDHEWGRDFDKGKQVRFNMGFRKWLIREKQEEAFNVD